MNDRAVILAVASPPGHSLRGIVRLSGAATFDLLGPHVRITQFASKRSGLFDRSRSPRSECAAEGRYGAQKRVARGVHRARIDLDGLDLPALLMCFRCPRSYTGEDAAELQLPGNPLLLQRVIDALIAAGTARRIPARRAEAGEFTARAYLSGRMSLTEAEGVAATIAAASDSELRAARMLRRGGLGILARELADELADALALLEAGIDFTDAEGVVAVGPDELAGRLGLLSDRLGAVLARSTGMEKLGAIPWVVLAGEPNAGKSTLFNALLGHKRAVVSSFAGTTRDVLTEPLVIRTAHGNAEVMLVDLAGDTVSGSPLVSSIKAAASVAIQRAELVLRCVPVDEPDAAGHVPNTNEVLVRTKVDRVPEAEAHEGLGVSARNGRGLDRLRTLIAQRLAGRAVSLAADALVLGARHEACLRSAHGHISEATDLLASSRGDRMVGQPELVAAVMRLSLDSLRELAGEISPDDVLGRIFATFCIGK
ncbi:MAG: 50S ribosome-binding GTPase [Planctomycetes bacterium]|nr:50S ribosome-binding GTPase [Planctomycetota bacterium]